MIAQISLNIDVNNLSSDLYSRKIDHNLLFLNCSIKKTFFKINNKFENCPNFIIKKYDNDSYIYLNYKKNYFRLVKFNENISLKAIWINKSEKSGKNTELNGAILPMTIVSGTITRRAVESTWLTASSAQKVGTF